MPRVWAKHPIAGLEIFRNMIGLKPPSCTEKIWLETTEGRFFSLGIPRCLMMLDDVEKVIHLLSCSFCCGYSGCSSTPWIAVGLLTKGNQKMIRRAAGSTGADEGLPPVNSPQIIPPNLWERIQKWWIYMDCHGFMKQEYCNQAMKKS